MKTAGRALVQWSRCEVLCLMLFGCTGGKQKHHRIPPYTQTPLWSVEMMFTHTYSDLANSHTTSHTCAQVAKSYFASKCHSRSHDQCHSWNHSFFAESQLLERKYCFVHSCFSCEASLVRAKQRERQRQRRLQESRWVISGLNAYVLKAHTTLIRWSWGSRSNNLMSGAASVCRIIQVHEYWRTRSCYDFPWSAKMYTNPWKVFIGRLFHALPRHKLLEEMQRQGAAEPDVGLFMVFPPFHGLRDECFTDV